MSYLFVDERVAERLRDELVVADAAARAHPRHSQYATAAAWVRACVGACVLLLQTRKTGVRSMQLGNGVRYPVHRPWVRCGARVVNSTGYRERCVRPCRYAYRKHHGCRAATLALMCEVDFSADGAHGLSPYGDRYSV